MANRSKVDQIERERPGAYTRSDRVTSAEAERKNPDSVFAHFQRLIRLRHELPVLAEGRFELLLGDDPQLWVIRRTLEDRTLLVVANCSSRSASVPDGALPVLDGARLPVRLKDKNSLFAQFTQYQFRHMQREF